MQHPKTTKEEDEIASQEALYLVGELRKKYSNNNMRDLDIILNTLCFSLVRLTMLNVNKNDYKTFVQLIANIIWKNLNKEE